MLFISREVMAEMRMLGKLRIKKKTENKGDMGQGKKGRNTYRQGTSPPEA